MGVGENTGLVKGNYIGVRGKAGILRVAVSKSGPHTALCGEISSENREGSRPQLLIDCHACSAQTASRRNVFYNGNILLQLFVKVIRQDKT